MLVEKVDFDSIAVYKEKKVIPVLVRIGDDIFEVTSTLKNADIAWGLFQKLFYNKVYSRESVRDYIDGLLNTPVFSTKQVIFATTDVPMKNNRNNTRETAAKFAKERYAIIMHNNYNNLFMLKRVIVEAKINDVTLYVAEREGGSQEEFKKELAKIKKQMLRGKRANKKIKKASFVVGHINNEVLSDEEKLIHYVRTEYKKRKLLGDILLDENQEKVLHEFMCEQMIKFVDGWQPEYNRLFALGIVRYAMKYYNKNHRGEFWPYFEEEYGVALPVNRQRELHDCFEIVMKANEKSYEDGIGNKIDNITMHSFVADNSANQLFDFLFDFWKHDLGRNAENMSRDEDAEQEFAALIGAMQYRNANVMTHTSMLLTLPQTKAIAKNRIRRIIRLMNDAFWNDSEVNETGNRINHLLNEWMRFPKGSFQKEKNYVAKHSSREKGEVLFHSPVLTVQRESDTLRIILPQQRLIECNAEDYPVWNIRCETGAFENAEVIPEFKMDKIGFYVEKDMLDLPLSAVLSDFEFDLSSNGKVLKSYRISGSNVRFFDGKGKYVDHMSAIIPEGFATAYSNSEKYPSVLDASVEPFAFEGLFAWDFDFVKGQVVVLNDGTGVQIGQKLHEGVNEVYPVAGAIIKDEQGAEYDIYPRLPKLLFKATKNEVEGVSLVINGKQNRVIQKGILEFKLSDDVSTYGYLVDLNEYIDKEGLYSVALTFPKFKQPREFGNIAYIRDFSYEFLNAPYIFESYAELAFDIKLGVVREQCKSGGAWAGRGRCNVFGFNFGERNPNSENYCPLVYEQHLNLKYNIDGKEFAICFEIPALYWKYSANDEWNTNQPSDILLKDLKHHVKKLYVTGPLNFSNAYLSTTDDVEIAEEESEIRLQNSKQAFFDLSRIYEWFRSDRSQRKRNVNLYIEGKTQPFFRVICKSFLREVNLFGDYENGCIRGNVDIEGNESYSISIRCGQEYICEFEPIVDNAFCIETEIKTGKYYIDVFELVDDEDDDGFDLSAELVQLNDRLIAKEIINISDLKGKKINLNNISDKKKMLKPILRTTYEINNLHRTSYEDILEEGLEILGIWDEAIDVGDYEAMNKMLYYRGSLVFATFQGKYKLVSKVLVIFKNKIDANSILILQYNKDEGAYVNLIVDSSNGHIISDEKTYTPQQKSRWLKMIFDDEYTFFTDIEEEKRGL